MNLNILKGIKVTKIKTHSTNHDNELNLFCKWVAKIAPKNKTKTEVVWLLNYVQRNQKAASAWLQQWWSGFSLSADDALLTNVWLQNRDVPERRSAELPASQDKQVEPESSAAACRNALCFLLLHDNSRFWPHPHLKMLSCLQEAPQAAIDNCFTGKRWDTVSNRHPATLWEFGG